MKAKEVITLQAINYYIFSFKSRTDCVRFDGNLKGEGVASEIVATPLRLSGGCSLSVRVQESWYREAVSVLNRGNYPSLIGVFEVFNDNFSTKTLRVL